MITASDSPNTVDIGDYYAILPPGDPAAVDGYCRQRGATRVAPGFSYDSGTNEQFLSVEEIRSLIREHIDPGF